MAAGSQRPPQSHTLSQISLEGFIGRGAGNAEAAFEQGWKGKGGKEGRHLLFIKGVLHLHAGRIHDMDDSGNMPWQLVIASPAVARLVPVSLGVGFSNILPSYLLKKVREYLGVAGEAGMGACDL